MDNKDGTNRSFTSTNKWTYEPGKVFTLAPLNIQDIKQLLDSSEEDLEDVESDTDNPIEEEKNEDEGDFDSETYKFIEASGVRNKVEKEKPNLMSSYSREKDVSSPNSLERCRKSEQIKEEMDQDLGHNSSRTGKSFTLTPLNIQDLKQLLNSSKDDIEDEESDRDNPIQDEENDDGGDFDSETYQFVDASKDSYKAEKEKPNLISNYNGETDVSSYNSLEICRKQEKQIKKDIDHDLGYIKLGTCIPSKASTPSPVNIQDVRKQLPESSQNNTKAEQIANDKAVEDEVNVYTENNVKPGIHKITDSNMMHYEVEKERPNIISNHTVEKSVNFRNSLEKCRKPEEQTRNEIDHRMKYYTHAKNNLPDHKDSRSHISTKVSIPSPLNIQDVSKQLPESSQNNTEPEQSDNDNAVEDKQNFYTENNVKPGIYKITDSNMMHNEIKKERPNINSNHTVEKSVSFQNSIEKCRNPEEQTRNEIDHGREYYTHPRNNLSDRKNSRMSLESIYEETLSYTKPVSIQNDVSENKENIFYNMEPLNLSTDKKRAEDSFDLDLSALSLHTPVKKKENFNYVTPKINIIPPSDTKSVNRTGTLFKTPNVSKNPYALKKLFKTPSNKPLIGPQYSGKSQQGTPFHSLKKTLPNGWSESKENRENQKYSGKNRQETPYRSLKKTFPNRQSEAKESCENEKVPTPLRLYPQQDEFERITVNNIEYIVMNLLGRGGSSEVFHCFNPEEKLHVAIKLVSLSDSTSAEGYINEVKLLESLQSCDRIIKMYDYEIQEDKLMVVLENGAEDLSTILKDLAKKQTHLPLYMLLYYWMEMLYAVNQIHSNGVIHSDLKPANFLRANSGLKLIDFGIASKVQGDMTCVYKSNQEGSCNYISPEALNVQTNGNVDSPSYGKPKYKVHFKSDVWSLGCILYQLVYRRTPFQHLNPIWTKLSAIVDPKHKIEYPQANWVPSRIVDTIKRCLQYDVKSRPSVEELLTEYEGMFRV